MKAFLSISLGLLAILAACTALSDDVGANKRPVDFNVEYHWNSGVQPSPRHFEYTVTISPAGEGKVVMIPDYPAYTELRWAETFSLQAAELDQLYEVMVKNGLFTRKWKRLEPEPPGCSPQSITVTAHGKRIEIPGCLASHERALAETIYSAAAATVPKAIWDKLNSQRDKYAHLTTSIGQEFTLKVGGEAFIRSEKLRVEFRSVLEDSRCPKNVDCVWVGRARILIAVHQGDNAIEEFELNTNPGEKREATYQGYRIKLRQLEPYPEGLEKIKREDYRATLVVIGKDDS